jgi:hypothetical protein
MKLNGRTSGWEALAAVSLIAVLGALAAVAVPLPCPSGVISHSSPESEGKELTEQVNLPRHRLNVKLSKRKSKRTGCYCLAVASERAATADAISSVAVWSGSAPTSTFILLAMSPGQMVFRSPPFPFS